MAMLMRIDRTAARKEEEADQTFPPTPPSGNLQVGRCEPCGGRHECIIPDGVMRAKCCSMVLPLMRA